MTTKNGNFPRIVNYMMCDKNQGNRTCKEIVPADFKLQGES